MEASGRALSRFTELFGTRPRALVRAPARVNIIGEHTDYNDGFVLPTAIDRELWIALAPRDDGVVEAASEEYGDRVRFRLKGLGDGARRARAGEEPTDGWGAYLQGVAWALAEDGWPLVGWQGVLASDIPVGAGLSSSAAIELAAARAFHVVSRFPWEPMAMARVCQRAENDWVGVTTGMMDQIVCAAGRKDRALLIDCRSKEVTTVPLPGDAVLAVLDTGTRRQLRRSAYGDRRRECEQAAAALGVDSLRDVPPGALEGRAGSLDPVLLRRACHVVTENARTLETVDALANGALDRAGALMDASHASLRDDFEVSSQALDAIVEVARDLPGCYGARMTGGGFAGCAVALVRTSAVEEFRVALPPRYAQIAGEQATVYVCVPVDGASVADLVEAQP